METGTAPQRVGLAGGCGESSTCSAIMFSCLFADITIAPTTATMLQVTNNNDNNNNN